jgi:hypothetical protein
LKRAIRTGLLLIIASLTTVTACGGESKVKIGGIMMLSVDVTDYVTNGTSTFVGTWNDCSGIGGYSDFGSGMDVSIRNGDGKLIGTTSTRNFKAEDLSSSDKDLKDTAKLAKDSPELSCTVFYGPISVPRSDFYEVEIGSRGTLTYSYEDLKAVNFWTFSTLGQ